MKKLYNKAGKVHPSPPTVAAHLALLPATILTLTVALSPEDKEVLAYLISCSNASTNFSITHQKGTQKSGGGGGDGGSGSGGDHPAAFQCSCFRCYMSFWARWDASASRQLIHEIIERYEEGLLLEQKLKKSAKRKKERKKRVSDKSFEEGLAAEEELGGSESMEVGGVGGGSGCGGEVVVGGGEDGGEGQEKGTVRKIVSFIGDRIWGVWNRV